MFFHDFFTTFRKIVIFSGLLLASTMAHALSPEEHYLTGKQALNGEKFQVAIDQFYELQRTFPQSPYTKMALLDLAYAYYRLGDFPLAITEVERFISENPQHPHLPFAYYIAGITRFTESQRLLRTDGHASERTIIAGQEALSYFGVLIERFPGSEYSEHAKLRSTDLVKTLSSYEHTMGSIAPLKQLSADFSLPTEIRKGQWVLRQSPEYFTLQLMRSPDIAKLLKIVEQYGLPNQAIIYETQRRNGKIYTLLYGLFNSEKTAMDVGSRLPNDILNSQPQIRPLNNIQSEITANQIEMAEYLAQKAEQTPLMDQFLATNIRLEKVNPIKNTLAPSPVLEEKTPQPTKVVVKKVPPQEPPAQQVAQTKSPSPPKKVNEANKKPSEWLREDWLTAQNPKHYTLQLVAMTKEKTVKKYLKKHKFTENSGYYLTQRDGKNWYAVFHGIYADRASAKKAATELAQSQNIKGSWVRRLKTIQKIIRQTNP